MLSREEYERAIRVFLVELNHLCLGLSEAELRALPKFGEDMVRYLADLRDPTNDGAQTLYTSFAYLDEYLAADWQRVTAAGYEAYLLSQQAGPGSPDE